MSWMRVLFSLLLGNAAGLAAFRLAVILAPRLWEQHGPELSFGLRILLIMITAILFAAPPVIIGAVAAVLAHREPLWAGLASGLWSFGFVNWWPAKVPLLPPEAWLAPTILVLLSGLVGGWLMDSRQWVRAYKQQCVIDNTITNSGWNEFP